MNGVALGRRRSASATCCRSKNRRHEASTSLTDIARAVPTPTASVHRSFGRQTLFAAVVERQTDQFVAALGHVRSGDETTADALGHVGAVLPPVAAVLPLVARLLAGRRTRRRRRRCGGTPLVRRPPTARGVPVLYDQRTGTLRADIDAAGVVDVINSHLVRRLATGRGATGPDDDRAAPPAATGG
jgi:AcrR family transcriptional regulator